MKWSGGLIEEERKQNGFAASDAVTSVARAPASTKENIPLIGRLE